MCVLGVEGWGRRIEVGGGVKNDPTRRCSINPAHNCFPTWCAVLLHKGGEAKGALNVRGAVH